MVQRLSCTNDKKSDWFLYPLSNRSDFGSEVSQNELFGTNVKHAISIVKPIILDM